MNDARGTCQRLAKHATVGVMAMIVRTVSRSALSDATDGKGTITRRVMVTAGRAGIDRFGIGFPLCRTRRSAAGCHVQPSWGMPEKEHAAQNASEKRSDQRSHRRRSALRVLWQIGPTKDSCNNYDDYRGTVRQSLPKSFLQIIPGNLIASALSGKSRKVPQERAFSGRA